MKRWIANLMPQNPKENSNTGAKAKLHVQNIGEFDDLSKNWVEWKQNAVGTLGEEGLS